MSGISQKILALWIAAIMLIVGVACAPGACVVQLLRAEARPANVERSCCADHEHQTPAQQKRNECPMCGEGIAKVVNNQVHFSAAADFSPIVYAIFWAGDSGFCYSSDAGMKGAEELERPGGVALGTLLGLHCALLI